MLKIYFSIFISGVIREVFTDTPISKEEIHYTCIMSCKYEVTRTKFDIKEAIEETLEKGVNDLFSSLIFAAKNEASLLFNPSQEGGAWCASEIYIASG